MESTAAIDSHASGSDNWKWMLLAVVLSFASFFPTLQNGWTNWDDEAYVLNNRMVQEFSGESIAATFTTPEQVGLYHPFTILSLAVDHVVWGNEPFGYHLSNLLLHLLNVVLVFLLFWRLCRMRWLAFSAAVLFGLHPMHLESVAWISARKDVLYTCFFLLSLLGYLQLRSAEAGKWRWYALSLLAFVAALLSKGMAFVLPVILLLLDYVQKRRPDRQMWLEKLPFFALSLVALLVAQSGQQVSDSMMEVDSYPLYKTVFIGMYNALLYIVKAVVPFNLSAFHPFPFQESIALPWYYYLSVLPFAVGLYLLYRAFRRDRWIFFCFAFFLVSIGPVLQVIPFGKAVMAERYTYVAYIGLFGLIGAGVQRMQPSMRLLPAAWVLALGIVSFVRAPIWKDSQTLWSSVIGQYPDHYYAYLARGRDHMRSGAIREGGTDLSRSVALNPGCSACYYERGRYFEAINDPAGAMADYNASIEREAGHHRSLLNRGLLYLRQNADTALALQDVQAAVAAEPEYALGHMNLGVILASMGELQSALSAHDRAVALEPWNGIFYRYRGLVHYDLKDFEKAAEDFRLTTERDPRDGMAWFFRAGVAFDLGDAEAARSHAAQAQKLGFKVPEAFLRKLP